MWEEFKKFIMRGNVVDLAVGVIIGLAFGAIVNSLVNDIIMPIIGAVAGGLNFSNYYLPLSSKVQQGVAYADAKKEGAVLGWGQFLTVALNFLIIASVLFLVIKGMNKLNKEQPPEPAQEPTPEVKLLTEIRDLLGVDDVVVRWWRDERVMDHGHYDACVRGEGLWAGASCRAQPALVLLSEVCGC